jgi:hypothetical protein
VSANVAAREDNETEGQFDVDLEVVLYRNKNRMRICRDDIIA